MDLFGSERAVSELSGHTSGMSSLLKTAGKPLTADLPCRLPEPKGRTYGALDILFEQRIPARKFASTVVDEFAAEERTLADSGGLATNAAGIH